jgi:uncharacterized surface protein with fasciclin (FAS1) repeats
MRVQPNANRAHSMTLSPANTRPRPADTAAKADKFKTLVAALNAAGNVGGAGRRSASRLGAGDGAFARLPPETIDLLLTPENRAKLKAILTYHVIPDDLLVADIVQLLLIADSVVDGVWSGIG